MVHFKHLIKKCRSQKPFIHSPIRFAHHTDLFEAHPKIRLGGASNQWILQAITASQQAIAQASQVETPVLILQAGDDSVIDNRAHRLYCTQKQHSKTPCQLITIPGARHELFIEKDEVRAQAIQNIVDFFSQ